MSRDSAQAACKRIFEKYVDVSQPVTTNVLLKCLQQAQTEKKVYSFLAYIQWNHTGLVPVLRDAIPTLEIQEAHEYQRANEREIMLATLNK